jgi:F0F1-type ATP synthase assembly protein I
MDRAERRGLIERAVADLYDRPARVAENRELYSNASDAYTLAFELVLTPLLLALVGHFIDRAAGTGVVFALVFGIIGLLGVSYRAYLAYTARMKQLSEGKPWEQQ